MSGMSGAGAWVAMVAFLLVFWTLVVAAVIAVAQFRRGDHDSGGSRADALLAERFARGEIDEREFAHQRAVLRGERS